MNNIPMIGGNDDRWEIPLISKKPSVIISIGGHEEIVRWWSRKYWKSRKYRQDSFERAYAKRQEILSDICERGRQRINGPKTGSLEWTERVKRELETRYSARNLDQHEEMMQGADASKVAEYLAYQVSNTKKIHEWARKQAHKYWSTRNIYQAMMHSLMWKLVVRTRPTIKHFQLCTTERIRVGRLSGDGYHGCGIYQKPMKPSSYGIG